MKGDDIMLFDYGKNFGLLFGVNPCNYIRLHHGFTAWKLTIRLLSIVILDDIKLF